VCGGGVGQGREWGRDREGELLGFELLEDIMLPLNTL